MSSNEIHQFDPDAVESIDQSSVEGGGPQFPTIQWSYGDQKLKRAGGMDYMGGWFVKEGQIDEDALVAAGWQRTAWSHDNGAEEQGFWRREIVVSVIATRRRWEVREGNRTTSFSWKGYDAAKTLGRPSGRLHALCIVKGLESVGPIVLTLKGSASVAFEGSRATPGALTQFAQTVIASANRLSDAAARKSGRTSGKRWPYRAFWLPVGAARDDKGEPLFAEVGKAGATTRVVLPAPLGLPDKADQVDLKRYYVGEELLRQAGEYWTQAESAWTHAWDALSGSETTGAGAGNSAGGGEAAQPAPETANEDVLASMGL